MDNNNKFKSNFIVSAAPHLVADDDTARIMGTVLIALLPALVVSVYVFGTSALILEIVCVASCAIFEWLYNFLMKKEQTVGDLSACVTGLLIAFNVPASLPIWMAIIGCFVAIVVVKQLFGGIGKNFANPAITARIFLLLSFSSAMTTWPATRLAADATSSATPLALIADGDLSSLPSLLEMFLGFTSGSLGEVSALAILIGGIFLIWRKVISYIIPLSYIGTVFVVTLIYYQSLTMALIHVCAGGLMLGAFFMATDFVTSPKLPLGQLIYGIGCGLLTVSIRLFGSYAEGVSFSILLMNIITPLINKWTLNMQAKKIGGAK